VHVVTTDPAAAFCPACGVVSSSVRQRRTTSPRDLPYGEQRLAVRWHKVQYACREGRCPRKAFTEQIAELPAGARITGRLRRQVGAAVGDGQAVSVAGAGLLSWPIAHGAFIGHAAALLTEPTAVTVLGIDETRRGRPRWTRCEATGAWVKLERFETNFVDVAGPQGLLGQASGRRKDNVIAWLDERGQDWKDQIQIVAMDPCATYRAAVRQALLNALIVADHFHLVSLANKTVTKVRRRVTLDTTGHRGTAKDPIWAKRTRLLRAKASLASCHAAHMTATVPIVLRVAVLTAIHVETTALAAHLENPQDVLVRGVVHVKGRLCASVFPCDVSIREIGPGNINTALHAGQVQAIGEADILLFVGIAGALKDLNIGDVVAATEVSWLHRGKVVDGRLLHREKQSHCTSELVSIARMTARNHKW